MLEIKLYQEKDRDKVLDLFYKTHCRRMTNEFWNWRFDNDDKKSIRCLMWEDDQVIGNYALHSLPLKIGENIEDVLFSMDTLTHPDHRNKGIFTKLANFAYDTALRANYRLIFGFPNQNSYKTFFGKLGWKDFGNIIEYEKEIMQYESASNKRMDYTITQINKFDERVDNLWNDHKNEYDFLIPRTKDYLNWRFIKHPKRKFFDYPDTEYFAFLIAKNDLQAYFVLKKFGDVKGHLVDYFGLLNNEIMEFIFRYAVSFCTEKKLNTLSFWSNPVLVKKNIQIHTELGFTPYQRDTYFGIKILPLKIREPFDDKDKWFVNMSDSDVY